MTEQQPEAPPSLTLTAGEFEAVRAVAERLGIAGTLRALAALAVGDDTGQPSPSALVKPQPRTGASEPDDWEALGRLVHDVRVAAEAKRAEQEGRQRFNLDPREKRSPWQRELDMAIGEAVAAAVRKRDGARVLDSAYAETVRREQAEAKLAAISDHCRLRMNAPGRSGMTRAAAETILGLAEGSGEGPS